MQISLENVGKLERRLTVTLPANRLEDQVNGRLRELSRTVQLKGFRPGKVPAKIIEQRFGGQVRSEAMGKLIRESFDEAVRQEKLRPAVLPSIQTSGQPENGEIRYTASFEVMPEIGPIDVSTLDVTRFRSQVEEPNIDEMIETLRLQQRTWTPVTRPAATGDLVLLESMAETAQGRVPAEGVERAGTIIGSNALFAALEQELIGLKAGEEKTFELTFPADYRVKTLAGQQAKMHVKPVRVSEPVIPAVDEAFMASFGVTEGGLEAFREEVKANLERELKNMLMARLKADVVEKLLAAYSELEFPARMIEAEARALVQQAERQKPNEPAPALETLLPLARRRVAAAVLLGEIARQNNINVDHARVAETLLSIASTYEQPEQVIELYKNDSQLMAGLQSRVVEDQVIDWIADHAALTEKTIGFAEAMRPSAPVAD